MRAEPVCCRAACLVVSALSPDAAQAWMERHLSARYRGLEPLFPSAFANITAAEEIPVLPRRCRGAPRVGKCAVPIGAGGQLIPASAICDNPAHRGQVPISAELASELQFQADTATNVLVALPTPEARDILFGDYVDELVADVVRAVPAAARPHSRTAAARARCTHYYFMIRTESVTEIPLRFCSFHLRFLSLVGRAGEPSEPQP
jgi:hypothetical protein